MEAVGCEVIEIKECQRYEHLKDKKVFLPLIIGELFVFSPTLLFLKMITFASRILE